MLLNFGKAATVRIFLLNENFQEQSFYTFNFQNILKTLIEIDMLINKLFFHRFVLVLRIPKRTPQTQTAQTRRLCLGSDLETFFNHLQPTTIRVKLKMSNFKVVNRRVSFTTKGEIDFVDLSDEIQKEVSLSDVKNGLAHVFAPHATGILILTENDEALLEDIKMLLQEIAPKQKSYQHPSNAHSHLRSILLPPDKTLPIIDGKVTFGTWQSLLFVETDVYPRKRTIIIQVMGEQ